MPRMNRILFALVLTICLTMVSLPLVWEDFSHYRLVLEEPIWHSKFDNFIDAVARVKNSLQIAIPDAQAQGVVTSKDQLAFITSIPASTYMAPATFMVPEDWTAELAAKKVALLDLGEDGVKINPVVSSSFVDGINLRGANLTATPLGVAVFATRNGPWPWGDGSIYSRDYGEPGQATLQTIKDLVGPLAREVSLYPGTWTISTKFTSSAHMMLKPMPGAILAVTIPDIAISGLSRANPCVVYWSNHGLESGEFVYLSGIAQAGGWRALNQHHIITKINADTFSIPVDTSRYAADYDPRADPGAYSQTVYIGAFRAGLYQCLDAAPGKVTFGPGAVDEVYPEWFGARADGASFSHRGINSAAASLLGGGTVKLADGRYVIASGLRLPNMVGLRGNGESSEIYLANNTTLPIDPLGDGYYPLVTNSIWNIALHQEGIKMRELKINGNRTNQKQSQKGVQIFNVDRALVENVRLTGIKGDALRTERCRHGKFDNNWIDGFSSDGILAFALNYYCSYDNNSVWGGTEISGVGIESEGRVGDDWSNFRNHFCSFNNNKVQYNRGKGMLLLGTSFSTATNNKIYQTGENGFTLIGCDTIDISGTIAVDCGITLPGPNRHGICLTGESYCESGRNFHINAIGCTASHCSGYGFLFSGESGSYKHDRITLVYSFANSNEMGDIYLQNLDNLIKHHNEGGLTLGSGVHHAH